MNEGQLTDGTLPPAGWDHATPSWFSYSRCTRIAMDMTSTNDLLIHNVQDAPPPGDPPNKEPIDPSQPDFPSTHDPTTTKAHTQIIGVRKVGRREDGQQLDCTTSIESTPNNGIDGIQFSPHTTFSRLNRFANKQNHGYINI